MAFGAEVLPPSQVAAGLRPSRTIGGARRRHAAPPVGPSSAVGRDLFLVSSEKVFGVGLEGANTF